HSSVRSRWLLEKPGSVAAKSSDEAPVPAPGTRVHEAANCACEAMESRCAIRATRTALHLLGRRATVDTFPIYLFIFLVFLNRYVFGLYLTIVRRKTIDETIDGYEPTITVVVPLYNEGRSIYDTILSLVKLDYPQDKLEVTVVDDCSTDDSYEWACKAAREYPNVTVLRNPVNMGKRKGINHAVRASKAEIIVSVDSDVIVYPTALRELVARFVSPQIAAVGGRIHVSNPNENWLTRLQTIKYYFGQEHLKNLERG